MIVSFELNQEELEALNNLSIRLDLTVNQVLRQAIRTYQYQQFLHDNPDFVHLSKIKENEDETSFRRN